MKQRIWELDAFRGLCLLGMICIHLVYDLSVEFPLIPWPSSPLFAFVMKWGGALFLILSGICATLGTRCVRRGIVVFAAGMVCTAVTAGLYALGMANRTVIIYFGVLHCLGVCMLLWPLFRSARPWVLVCLGLGMVGAGLYLEKFVRVDFPWLIALGLRIKNFQTADYFPLLPHLGWFLLGAALGKTVYRQKKGLLPQKYAGWPPVRFLCLCGRNSLLIYLLHQPVLTALIWIILQLGKL